MGSIFGHKAHTHTIVDDTLSRREKATEDDKRRENKRFCKEPCQKRNGYVLMTVTVKMETGVVMLVKRH